MPATLFMPIGGAALLLFALVPAAPVRAQAPLIPPAASPPLSAAPVPPLPESRGLVPPPPGEVPSPPPAALPGLPDLPLAAPPVPPPVRIKVRVSVPASTLKLPPTPLILPRVTEQQIVYGRSAQGRALTAFVLDSGAAHTDTTVIFGGFHGNERSTPDVVERLRSFLKQSPLLWPNQRVVLVPFANPDGWARGTRDNARGVDINRNFPAGWSAAARAVRYSPGPRPASEPETQAIIDLLARCRPAKVVSLHSPLRCLNWTGKLGRTMALLMHTSDHLPVKGDIGYPTPGSLGDYCGARHIGIVTLELADEGADAAWQENKAAFLAVINLRSDDR